MRVKSDSYAYSSNILGRRIYSKNQPERVYLPKSDIWDFWQPITTSGALKYVAYINP